MRDSARRLGMTEENAPMRAGRLMPTVAMHSTMVAPELSMQFSIVCKPTKGRLGQPSVPRFRMKLW